MSHIKVGSILVCKRAYQYSFKVGEKYLITEIRYDNDYKDHKVILSSNTHGHYWFLLSKIENKFYIYNWFYDVSEYRKEKLKKLNELSEKI